MAVLQAFRRKLAVAKESSWGTLPGSPVWYPIRATSWQMTQMNPRARSNQARQGTRDQNVLVAPVGRKHSEGNLNTEFHADVDGLLLLSALGADTVSAAPGTAVTRKKHLIQCANRGPSIAVHDFEVAQVSSVDKAYQFPGVEVDQFTFTFDATGDVNLIQFAYRFIGKSYGSATTDMVAVVATSYSVLRPIQAWAVTTTEAAVQDTKILSMSLTYNNNVARVKAGVGSQEDQDHALGARVVSGSLTRILPDVNSEGFASSGTASAENTGVIDFLATFTGNNFIEAVSSVNYYDGLVAHIPQFSVEGYPVRGERDGYQIETINFVGNNDQTVATAPLEFEVYNAVASY